MPNEDSNNKEQKEHSTCESCSIDYLLDAEDKDNEEKEEE